MSYSENVDYLTLKKKKKKKIELLKKKMTRKLFYMTVEL